MHVVVSDCDVNMCQNNGTCMKHVLTYTCDCPSGFIGAFCQEKGVFFTSCACKVIVEISTRYISYSVRILHDYCHSIDIHNQDEPLVKL